MRKLPIAKAALALIALLQATSGCARLGESGLTFSEQELLPEQLISTGEDRPGMGASGGPLFWSFWAKNRTAASDAMVASFAPFYRVNAVRLAVSPHFVFYRDVLQSTPNAAQAASILATLENAYNNLKMVYGGSEHPYPHNAARIVILALDILDDYTTTGNYVGGFFSPRDLYSNRFTTALFTDPVAIQQYAEYIATLGGYSNELSIIYYDTNPGFTSFSQQVNDIVIHELSHLFVYNKRVIRARLANHDLWIAEGLAETAPHATIGSAYAQDMRLQQLASPAMIEHFQKAPQLVDFATWGPKIVGYLQSNLFFNYLRHRAELQSPGSANTLFSQLVVLPDTGLTGLESLLLGYTGTDFPTLYGDYVATHYLMLLGIPINATVGWNGGPANPAKYSMLQVQIGNSAATVDGVTIKTKYPNTIPFNFDPPRCPDGSAGLKPNSYAIFRHRYDGFDKHGWDSAGSGAISGELRLRYLINLESENAMISGSPPATVRLREYIANDATDPPNLPLASGGFGLTMNDYYHILVYNPNRSGSCRRFNDALISRRNHSKWAGFDDDFSEPSPDFRWHSDSGAPWRNNRNGGYYRPAGVAVYTGGSYPNNFIYVTDYLNMSVQRLNLETGEPEGRLGSTALSCPTSDTGWDYGINRYLNHYCSHHFDMPQGVHVDSAHTIYVADAQNRRVVRYDSSGNYQGWLGRDGGHDTWQAAGTEQSPADLYNNGALTDPRMFLVPWAIASDSTYLYIVDYGNHRIIRRDRTTGAFHSYVGNGHSGWNSSTAPQLGTFGAANGYFHFPRGIVHHAGKLYVVDELNHRVVRINATTGAFEAWLGDGHASWVPMSTLPSGVGSRNNKYFRNPSAITTDGTYLYIADRLSNRIVKWRMDGSNCAAPARSEPYCGWIGHGKVGWEFTQPAPPSDPYAGVSYYPPDYYAEPNGLALATATAKGTRNNYLFVTSVYNGRVTRINLGCVDAPSSSACDPLFNPFMP